MTPFEYADTYHQLQVEDSLLGLNVNLTISKYKADWAQETCAFRELFQDEEGSGSSRTSYRVILSPTTNLGFP
jgi:hypothetical protein